MYTLDTSMHALTNGEKSIHLTPQELAFMVAMSKGGNVPKGSNAVYASRIRNKMTHQRMPPLIKTVYGVGYTLVEQIEVLTLLPYVIVPGEFGGDLLRLLDTHPDRLSALRILAAIL